MTIGERITDLKEKKGLNTNQLAKEMNEKQPTIYRIEKDQREPTLRLVIKLCSYFNVSADELLGLKKDRA